MKTVFIQIDSQYKDNPVARALKAVVEVFGGLVVEQLVTDDVEADIAVTNSVNSALRLMKETEHTKIVLAWFHQREKDACMALAARYPDRMTSAPFIGTETDDKNELVPYLASLIATSPEAA